jgi:hypothetical protein
MVKAEYFVADNELVLMEKSRAGGIGQLVKASINVNKYN